MALVNENFLNLQTNYLFVDIAKKVKVFKTTNPKADIINELNEMVYEEVKNT